MEIIGKETRLYVEELTKGIKKIHRNNCLNKFA